MSMRIPIFYSKITILLLETTIKNESECQSQPPEFPPYIYQGRLLLYSY